MLRSRIEFLMSSKNLTVEELAAKAELEADRVAKILSGERSAASLDIAKIAAAFQVSVDWLIGNERAADEWPGLTGDLRDHLARTIREHLRIHLGPNALRIANDGADVILNMGEAGAAADALLEVVEILGLKIVDSGAQTTVTVRLPPFSGTEATCPKCGDHFIAAKEWIHAGQPCGNAGHPGWEHARTMPDRFHRTCAGCYYTWDQASPAPARLLVKDGG